jgi:hypothetical protein
MKYASVLGAFADLRKATVTCSVAMCLFIRNSVAPPGRIFMKSYTGGFLQKSVEKFKFFMMWGFITNGQNVASLCVSAMQNNIVHPVCVTFYCTSRI